MQTTVSLLRRAISVRNESGDTDRFALVRSPDGDVHWRHDLFGPTDFATGEPPWLSFGGRLTVGEVLARVPHCEREILDWTREELELGVDDLDYDIFTRDARQRALTKLEAELSSVAPSA